MSCGLLKHNSRAREGKKKTPTNRKHPHQQKETKKKQKKTHKQFQQFVCFSSATPTLVTKE